MEGLKAKKYLQTSRKRFDPLALALSLAGLGAILYNVAGYKTAEAYVDWPSLWLVVGGTVVTLLFQFDFSSLATSALVIARSFLGTPEKKLLALHHQLDEAILRGLTLVDLREGRELSGEILNDVNYMYQQGLLFEEIDEFVTSRIQDEFFHRQVAVIVLNRAALVAPALGLFGTVIGLIGVLNSLANPSQIGPSMSLALMTTAYGAGLGTLVFTPLAGRLEHHNSIHLEFHKQLLSKIGVLLHRDERRFDHQVVPEVRAGG